MFYHKCQMKSEPLHVMIFKTLLKKSLQILPLSLVFCISYGQHKHAYYLNKRIKTAVILRY